jgi:hypothetical protein
MPRRILNHAIVFANAERNMENRFLAICRLAVMLAIAGAAAAQQPANASNVCTQSHLKERATVDRYIFTGYVSDDGACLTVTRNGSVVFRRTTDSGTPGFTLGQPGDMSDNVPAIANGTDVTGRGHPEMIVSLYSGGAHCCSSHYVFELEPVLRLLATLNDAHDDMAHFERIDRNGPYYYLTADWTFAYWPDCFACSPSEEVVLRFVDAANGGGFHLALDKMSRPAPTAAKWKHNLESVKESLKSRGPLSTVGTTLWQPVMDLIYTGHSDLAWKFLDEAGPAAQQKPLPNLQDFCSLLKNSLYWPDLEKTIQNAPPACSNAKPKSTGI